MDPMDRRDNAIPSHQPGDMRNGAYTGVAKWTCWILGSVFLLVALLGFLGDEMVFGVFMVNTLHNIVHLLSGAVLLAMGFLAESAARATLWVFAALYGIVMILGFAGVAAFVDMLNVNPADNWLHLFLTLVFVVGALASQAQARTAGRPITRPQHR